MMIDHFNHRLNNQQVFLINYSLLNGFEINNCTILKETYVTATIQESSVSTRLGNTEENTCFGKTDGEHLEIIWTDSYDRVIIFITINLISE